MQGSYIFENGSSITAIKPNLSVGNFISSDPFFEIVLFFDMDQVEEEAE